MNAKPHPWRLTPTWQTADVSFSLTPKPAAVCGKSARIINPWAAPPATPKAKTAALKIQEGTSALVVAAGILCARV